MTTKKTILCITCLTLCVPAFATRGLKNGQPAKRTQTPEFLSELHQKKNKKKEKQILLQAFKSKYPYLQEDGQNGSNKKKK